MADARVQVLRPHRLEKAGLFAAVATAGVVATFAGLSAGSGSKLGIVLPMALVVGVGLGLLALTRFKTYIVIMLLVRASLDLTKVSGSLSGAQTADPAARALDPTSLLAVLFLFAAAFWLAAQHRAGRLVPGSTPRRALIAFAAAGILSVVGSLHSYGPSLLEWTRILAAVLMFIVLEQLMADPAELRRLLVAVYLSAALPLLVTAAGFLLGSPRQEIKGEVVRAIGPFNQSNAFGRYLMLLTIFGVAIYPSLERRHRRLLGVLLAGSALGLMMTYTLSAIIATVVGLLVVGLVSSKRTFATVLVVAVAALLLVPQLSSRFTELTSSDPLASSSPNTLDWRFGHWTQVLPLANSNPVTGIGLANISRSTDIEAQSHNDFVRVYVETGVIGLLAYLSVLIALLSLGMRALKLSSPKSFDRSVAAGFLGCAVAFVAVSLVANVISNVVFLWYFLAFAAAVSSVVRRNLPVRFSRPVHAG